MKQRRKLFIAAGATLAISATLIGLPASAAPQVINNGSIFTTTTGAELQAHGGGIIKVGSFYYFMGENRKDDGHFNAVSMYRSSDLKNWEFRNDILRSTTAAELNVSNVERPKVIFNSSTGEYVLWAHWENGADYSQARVLVATSNTVDGNYTYHGSFRPLGFDSRDMTVFKDADGSAYLISASNVNFDLHIYLLNSSYTGIASLVHNIAGYHREAPAVFKRGSTYFMVTSGATGWTPNQAAYLTATNMAGPWSAPVNFGNGNTYNSQSTFVLPIQGTAGTSYLYLGDRWGPAQDQRVNQSQYVWLPLTFPSATSLAMNGRSQITIDAAAGTTSLGASATTLYKIRSATSGYCVNVANELLAYTRSVMQYDCANVLNEQVEPRAAGSNIQFVFQQSGLCLAQNDTAASGGPVVQHGCTQPKAQWFWSGTRLVNRLTGACLMSPNNTRTALVTATCDGGADQNWSLLP